MLIYLYSISMWLDERIKWRKATNPVSQNIDQVERDCLRKLDYVELQLDRILRKKKKWDRAMTVYDEDILQMGRFTHTMSAMRLPKDKQIILTACAIGALLIFILFVFLLF